ncbi:MAG TPA: isoprenylcysteine carboxylmethyltransferase family protein [Armatimonadota bacterium]|nr:isoprenylcysteine carboxylmethyltransferase family protein [Armatimonadota bacterium]
MGSKQPWLNDERMRWLHAGFVKVRIVAAVVGVALVVYCAADVPIVPVAILLVVGEFGQLWAAANLGKISGPQEENEVFAVAESGPYACVRNPMYIGRFIVGLGLSLVPSFRWYVLPVFVLVYVIYVHARVLREEPRITEEIGEEYVDYCRRVNRWLPRWPARGSNCLSWSWVALHRNRQLRVTAGLALLMALVILRPHMG